MDELQKLAQDIAALREKGFPEEKLAVYVQHETGGKYQSADDVLARVARKKSSPLSLILPALQGAAGGMLPQIAGALRAIPSPIGAYPLPGFPGLLNPEKYAPTRDAVQQTLDQVAEDYPTGSKVAGGVGLVASLLGGGEGTALARSGRHLPSYLTSRVKTFLRKMPPDIIANEKESQRVVYDLYKELLQAGKEPAQALKLARIPAAKRLVGDIGRSFEAQVGKAPLPLSERLRRALFVSGAAGGSIAGGNILLRKLRGLLSGDE
jgi:hypothetical protein